MSTTKPEEPTAAQQELAAQLYSAARDNGESITKAKVMTSYELMHQTGANTRQATLAAARAALAYEQTGEQNRAGLRSAIEQLAEHDQQSAPPITDDARQQLLDFPGAFEYLIALSQADRDPVKRAKVLLFLSRMQIRINTPASVPIEYSTAEQEADNLIRRMSMVDAPTWRGLLVDALARAEAHGYAEGLDQ